VAFRSTTMAGCRPGPAGAHPSGLGSRGPDAWARGTGAQRRARQRARSLAARAAPGTVCHSGRLRGRARHRQPRHGLSRPRPGYCAEDRASRPGLAGHARRAGRWLATRQATRLAAASGQVVERAAPAARSKHAPPATAQGARGGGAGLEKREGSSTTGA
jgi:hypothetical protein